MKKLSISKPQPKEQDAPIKQASNTMRKENGKAVDLNFKVDPEFKRDFKMFAAARDLSQKQVLEMAFALLKASSV
ncbi:MAG: hypothetical protein ACRC9R_04645 [Enterovibrio sp.]